MKRIAYLLVGLGCGRAVDSGLQLEPLQLQSVTPITIVPGTTLRIAGDGFAPEPWEVTQLDLLGSPDNRLPTQFIDYDQLTAIVNDDVFQQMDTGTWVGDVQLRAVDLDGGVRDSAPLPVQLRLARTLVPQGQIAAGSVVRIGDPIEVNGGELLFGGGEGQSVAEVSGCFAVAVAEPCVPIQPVQVPIAVRSREQGTFPFAVTIAGAAPGRFAGHVVLINRHAGGEELRGAPQPLTVTVVEPAIFAVTPTQARLGQYVVFSGGGFVGGMPSAITTLELTGQLTKAGTTMPFSAELVPEVESGNVLRYVLNEDDFLGQRVDLRRESAQFTGTVTPLVILGNVTTRGQSHAFALEILPPKQVVFLDVRPTFVEGLREFGLRAARSHILERIVRVVQEAYPAVGIEVRLQAPTDYAWFAHVELHGEDPNGRGLFGYDNTPGKDVDNQRLYDQLGGVNAATQQDGALGYGGVFLRSLFAFSLHAPDGIDATQATSVFDEIFDFARPDRDGVPLQAGDLAAFVPRTDAIGCPATARAEEVRCAIFVLGNLIGTTLAHELGHSLGLANPYGDGFHNPGDQPNRIMDAGVARPFEERAQLSGQGPGQFCAEEYEYLRTILPTSEAADGSLRPTCN